MLICLLLYVIYGVGLLLSTFALFERSESMNTWILRIQNSTESGLLEIAKMSTDEALRYLKFFFFGAAGVLFIAYAIVKNEFHSKHSDVISVFCILFVYIGASINAWSHRRVEIIDEFKMGLVSDARKAIKFAFLISLLMLLIIISISFSFNMLPFGALKPALEGVVLLGLALVVSAIAVKFLSLGFIFVPALIAISYLWMVVSVAKITLKIGRKGLFNLFIAYFIVGSLYFALLSLPGLRLWMNIPAICQ